MNSYPVAIMFSVTVIAVCFLVYLYWFKGTSIIYKRLTELEAKMNQVQVTQGLQGRNPLARPPTVGGL
jgi:hypothetical protein